MLNSLSECKERAYWTHKAVTDPGENLTGALHSNFGRGGCNGRG